MTAKRTPILLATVAFALVAFVPTLAGLSGTSSLGTGLDFGGAMDAGLAVAIGVVFLGGVLTSLTPCVYPLIPVTVAVFGSTKAKGRARSMLLSSSYVLGMAVMYSIMGLAAAMTGRLLGSVLTSVWVMGGISILFVLFAASLLGAFEMRLPAGLQTRLARVGGDGVLGAFAMGLVAGLIAAPCTGPVLGGVLTYVAASQDVLLGAALLFVFALGMGLLFWVIGTFSLRLPRSGPWMEGVRSFFAVVMLVAALWFLKDAVRPLRALMLPGEWVPFVSAAIVASGVLLGGIHRTFGGGRADRLLKGVGLAFIVTGLFVRLGTVAAVPLGGSIDWLHDEPEAVELARAEDRPMLVDFRADWCSACVELERRTFVAEDVAIEARRFVALKVDATFDTDPEVARLLAAYRVNGLPSVLFIDSSGVELRHLRVETFVPPGEMLGRMRLVE